MAKGTKEVMFHNERLEWVMGLRKSDKKDAREFVIPVSVVCNDVTREDFAMVCGGGQSTRVKVQSLLRKKSSNELASLESTGFEITWQALYTNERTPMSIQDRLMLLSKPDFIEELVNGLGVDEETAEQIYKNKHGLN